MSKLFAVRSQKINVDLVLLGLRLVCGSAFVFHGYSKILTPFSWMPPSSDVPSAFQGLAALAEFGGGLALIFGLLTRLGAFGLFCTMAVAVYFHRFSFGDPFVNVEPNGHASYELAFVYLLVALLFIAIGPGRFSGDRIVFGQKS